MRAIHRRRRRCRYSLLPRLRSLRAQVGLALSSRGVQMGQGSAGATINIEEPLLSCPSGIRWAIRAQYDSFSRPTRAQNSSESVLFTEVNIVELPRMPHGHFHEGVFVICVEDFPTGWRSESNPGPRVRSRHAG